MTVSEFKFRGNIKKIFNDNEIYIRKIPDKKQTGMGTGTGLPDYLVITRGKTYWFEVKLSPTKSTFNLSLISETQYIEFTKMKNAGAIIILAVYIDKQLYLVDYNTIFYLKFVLGQVSISLDKLMIMTSNVVEQILKL